MMLVTMAPRILPLFVFDAEKLPQNIRDFLGFIPYTVLGALILPGGLSGIAGNTLVSGLCLAFAALIAWYREGIIGPIVGAVCLAVLMNIWGIV